MSSFFFRITLFLTCVSFLGLGAQERPNILWVVVDDMSANFSCYGEELIETPHVDQLAKEGTLFKRAYATSPVCSTFRSAMITGMYQNSIGAHHHRSGRGKHRVVLPQGVRPVPELFKEAGYFTCIGSGLPGLDSRCQPLSNKVKSRLGKTDYNFDWDKKMYDSHDWADRKAGQPFFMQVQLHGGKMRGASENHYKKFDTQVKEMFGRVTDPNDVKLPPYYPRDPIMLKDWSTYLDSVKVTDHHVGLVVDRLKKEGLLENTLVVFFTDHGISHARGKQFLYDEGTHIPLVIRGPGVETNKVRMDMVEHIDIAALSLAFAGVDIPVAMEGEDILATDRTAKKFVFAARDRCGEAADRIRSVRSEEFLYLKNFYPERPFLMPSNYKDSKLILTRLRELRTEGKVNELGEKILFSEKRPPEELYQYKGDKWQIVNLANNPEYEKVLLEHRQALDQWIVETGDPGEESLDVYQMEVDDQMRTMKGNSLEKYRANSELYKRWMKSGK